MCGGVGEENGRGAPVSERALSWAALQQVEGVGAGTMLRLARVFGSPEAALWGSREDLVGRGKLSARQAEQVVGMREKLELVQARMEAWRGQGIAVVETDDVGYPDGLRALHSPPPLLYVRGTLTPEDERAVAVVGTREPDREGARAARMLAKELARRGFTVVSGLARGIDTAGHRGALGTEEGRTIAVLGCGLLEIYPPENGMLARQIAARGCLVAEAPPETRVNRRLLLARNRLQAALSRAVIVVQAHAECGSMVTARHAVQCGRILFGVPWSEPPFSAGWERLREMGAQPIGQDGDLEALVEEMEGGARESEQRSLM